MGLIEQLKSTGFSFNKRLGQNFIADEGFLQSVVAELNLGKSDTVVEVGTGAGTLTRTLARVAGRVVTYEIDKRLEPVLHFDENVELVFADVLKAKMPDTPFTVVANIPYYITTPLIMKFLNDPNCVRICVLVQADVARRIVAKPGTKDYGALSVGCQAQAECKILKLVPRGLFIPQPSVDSAFVAMSLRAQRSNPYLEKLLKTIFSARRKTILNALSNLVSKEKAREILAKAGIAETVRPEQIPPEKFVELARLLFDKKP